MRKIGTYAIILCLMVFTLSPFAWLLVASVSPQSELLTDSPRWIPEKLTLENYRALFTGSGVAKGDLAMEKSETAIGVKNFLLALKNSIITALYVMLLTLAATATGSYALSRIKFRGYRFCYLFFFIIRMFPAISVVIPLFLIMSSLGLINTKLGLALSYVPFTITLALPVLKGYFDTIPTELDEAAEIDGCTPLKMIWHILIPLSAPAFLAAGIFTFTASWNEFLFALILTSTYSSKTIPIALAEFNDMYVRNFTLTAAGAVVSAMIPVIFTLLFQKFIVSGLTSGSVKS